MKKAGKIFGIVLAILALVIAIFYYKNNEALPEGVAGKEADALARKMLSSLNFEAFQQTEYMEWSFRNAHHYEWNKAENTVKVSWDNMVVSLDTKTPTNSVVVKATDADDSNTLIQKAFDYFNNDSFWLVAPYKVFDPGVRRSIVKHEGKDALLVTYTSGGSTPGDSYLWILDEHGQPKSYKMWVGIIPIGGIEASWEGWKTTSTGAVFSTQHKIDLFGMKLPMENVSTSNPKADALAKRVLKKIKHDAYKNTRYLEWSFGGNRSFKWDKKNHIVDVSWKNNKVTLHPNEPNKSRLFIDGKETIENKEKILKTAEKIFNNDSFWLVAPHKLFEDGIIRNTVTINGKEALKVTYTKGGSTPGDSYIWILNEDFLPVKYLMTVPSMKMTQVPATWEGWFTTASGTLLPKTHAFAGGRTLSMGNVKAYN